MPFKILKFNLKNLRKCFSNEHVSSEFLDRNSRIDYLLGYLKELQCKTILVEEEYIEGGYLDDFSQYYVKCFRPYDRFCKRIHFFSNSFNKKQFDSLIEDKLSRQQEKRIISNYLGCIAAKPLPEALIGRTLLKTYPSENGRRNFPCVSNYTANIFGLGVTLKSLPFQEQDTVIAACATTALWTAFQKCSQLFGTESPTPAKITQYATSHFVTSRPIPSHGLNVYQICEAIREVNLEPEVFRVTPRTPLASLMYAYMHSGVPIILGLDIERRGMHAVTLSGYSIEKSKVLQKEVHPNYSGYNLKGLYISKFYAHDDQIGPFSRLKILSGETVERNSQSVEYPLRFLGSWKDDNGNQLLMDPVVVIIPVYHKIRVNFFEVVKWTRRIDNFFASIGWAEPTGPLKIEWNVFLTTVNELKTELWQSRGNSSIYKNLLTESHPRFIWRIQSYYGKKPLFEIFADATDMARSFFIYKVWFSNREFGKFIGSLMSITNWRRAVESYLSTKFLELLERDCVK